MHINVKRKICQERMNYEESLKDFRDMYSVMKTQLEKGRKEGREEGIAIGVEKGREEGRIEGREEGRIEGREEGIAIATLANAKALIEQGIPKDAVQKALSLTDEQMKEL